MPTPEQQQALGIDSYRPVLVICRARQQGDELHDGAGAVVVVAAG
jgi:hypothetical protein